MNTKPSAGMACIRLQFSIHYLQSILSQVQGPADRAVYLVERSPRPATATSSREGHSMTTRMPM